VLRKPLNILFVCLGNICRSPLLEGWARHVAERSGHGSRFAFDSAGTGDWHVGQPPDPRAIAAAHRCGIDIAGLRARTVQAGDFSRFELILAADRANLAWLRRRAPAGSRARIELALDWAGSAGEEVPDPYTGTDADFDAVCRLAEAVAHGLLRASPRQS
jgi:protein-tyrosine phosphatase